MRPKKLSIFVNFEMPSNLFEVKIAQAKKSGQLANKFVELGPEGASATHRLETSCLGRCAGQRNFWSGGWVTGDSVRLRQLVCQYFWSARS